MRRKVVQKSNEPMGLRGVRKETERHLKLAESAEKRLELAQLGIKEAEKKGTEVGKDNETLFETRDTLRGEISGLETKVNETNDIIASKEGEVARSQDTINMANKEARSIVDAAKKSSSEMVGKAQKTVVSKSEEYAELIDKSKVLEKDAEKQLMVADKLDNTIRDREAIAADIEGETFAKKERLEEVDHELGLLNEKLKQGKAAHGELKAVSKELSEKENELRLLGEKIEKEQAALDVIQVKQAAIEKAQQDKIDENRNLVKVLDVRKRKVERMIEEAKVKKYLKNI